MSRKDDFRFDKNYVFLQDVFGLSMLEEAVYMRLMRRRVKPNQGTRLVAFRGAQIAITTDWLLVSERTIADEMRAPRTSVQRAIKKLHALGLIRSQSCRRSGLLIFVTPPAEIPGLNQFEFSNVGHVDNSARPRNDIANFTDKNGQWASAGHQVGQWQDDLNTENLNEISDEKVECGPVSGPPDNTNTQIKHTDTGGALKNLAEKAKFRPASPHNISTTAQGVNSVDTFHLPPRIPKVSSATRFRAEYPYQRELEKWISKIEEKEGHEAKLSALRACKQIRETYFAKASDILLAIQWLERNGCVETGEPPRSFLGYLIACFPKVLEAAQKQEEREKVRYLERAKRAEKEDRLAAELLESSEKQNRFMLLPQDTRESIISIIRHQNPNLFGAVKMGSYLEASIAIALWEPDRDYFTSSFK